MAEEETQVVTLTDDFYRDSFSKLVIILGSVCIAFLLLLATSIYLIVSKPDPMTFAIGEEWRVQPPVPVSQPYLSTADLLQWVADVLPGAFVYDFVHYNQQLKDASKNFTTDGWKVFLN